MNSSDNSVSCVYAQYVTSNSLLTAVAVLMATISVYTFLANGTVFVAMIQTVCREGQRGLQITNSHSNNSYITKLFMLSMTFSGVLVGGFMMPIALMDFVNNGRWKFGQALYKVRVYSDYLLCGISSLHLAIMAIDTYLVICKSLLYRLLTANTGYIMIALGWLIPVLFIIVWCLLQYDIITDCYNIFKNMPETLVFNLCFASFFLLVNVSVWILYFLVLLKIKHFSQAKFSQKSSDKTTNERNEIKSIYLISTKPLAKNEDNLTSNKIIIDDTVAVLPDRKLKRNVKCFRFVGSILISFSTFWLPPYILLFLASLKLLFAPDWLLVAFIWLTYMSSSVNPHLYCTNTAVRLAVKRLMCKFNGSKLKFQK